MGPEAAPAVHSLLRVADPGVLLWDARQPRWTGTALRLAPWTVVRRAPPRDELWPVGVRGSLRAQRCAAWLPRAAIQECITPQMLAAEQAWRRARIAATPAIIALDEAAAVLAAHGYAGRWGPGGSVGFELASGVPTTTADSDLDLVLSVEEPMTRSAAALLQADLAKFPVRIDLLLETRYGAAALTDYANGSGKTLLRSTHGPRLVDDPWNADTRAGRA